MEQETERTDPVENVVQFFDAVRRRRSFAQFSQTTTESVGAPEDDGPPPDAA
jgi:hypothetical protein